VLLFLLILFFTPFRYERSHTMKLTVGSLFQKYPSNAFVVCVAATVPQGNGAAPVDFHWEEVAPSRKLRQLWDVSGKGILAQSGYLNFYKAQLRDGQDSILATFGRIVRQAKDAGKTHIVLCCYEGKNSFCHRHYLRSWLLAQMADKDALTRIRKAAGETQGSPQTKPSPQAEAAVDSEAESAEKLTPQQKAARTRKRNAARKAAEAETKAAVREKAAA